MEHRVRVLERRQRITFAVMFATLLCSCVLGLTSYDDDNGVVSAQRFIIENEAGDPLLELDAAADAGRIVIRSSDGHALITLDADSRGGRLRVHRAQDGKPVASMHAYPVTGDLIAGMVETLGPDGRPAVSIGSGNSGPGPVSMGARCDGGVVVISQHDDIHRIDACWIKAITHE